MEFSIPGNSIASSSLRADRATNVSLSEAATGLLFTNDYWGPSQFTYSTPTATSTWPGYAAGTEPANGYSALTAAQAVRYEAAAALWDSYIAPSFVKTDDATAPGNFRIAFTNYSPISAAWGYATSPPYQAGTPQAQSGDIWINANNSGATFASGTYDWEALLHEWGHALGLKHPFETPTLPAAYDSRRYTVMSYTDPVDRVQWTFKMAPNGSVGADPTAVDPSTPMVLDIAAIQSRYGADPTTNAGANVYTFDQDKPFFQAIYDAGGVDTIDLSAHTRGSVLDLTPGAYSSIAAFSVASQIDYWKARLPAWTASYVEQTFANQGASVYTWTDNLGLAFTTTIENATGGSGDDVFFGNTAANGLSGGAGTDTLYGFGGDDRLSGGLGINRLDGGEGIDFTDYSARTGGLWLDLGAGYYSSADAWDLLVSIEGVIGGSGNDQLFGTTGDDLLQGGAGNDVLTGRAGSDRLAGGVGLNDLQGGDGDDFADYSAMTTGVYVDLSYGSFASATSYDNFGSIEGLIGGSGNDFLLGTAGANTLMGGDGADVLIGRGGNDILMGGAGNDRLIGDIGDDSFYGGAGADVFDVGTGGGRDTAFDFNRAEDRIYLGGPSFSALAIGDYNGDGASDSQLTYGGGMFVALGISTLTLNDWNGLLS